MAISSSGCSGSAEAFLVEAEKFAWLIPFAITLLPAGLALFTGLATAVARLKWPPGLARVIILALALSVAEWLRGHVLTGFPWNTLGYALTAPLTLMQSASLFGVYGLTILTVVIFASPLVVAAAATPGPGRIRTVAAGAAIAIVPLVLLYGYGLWRLSGGPDPTVDGVHIRIVQASVPQRDKWRAEKQGIIFQDQLDLSRRDAVGAPRRSRRHHPPRLARGGDAVPTAASTRRRWTPSVSSCHRARSSSPGRCG